MGNKNYLDASQKQAVCHCHGPALVLAGPGSGKTGTLIAHISYLLENHLAKPCELLVITYTKEAAASMQKRFEKENGRSFHSITFCTFHSLAYQILQKEIRLKNNSIISQKEKEKLLLFLMQKFGEDKELAGEYLRLFSLYKNGCQIEEHVEKAGISKMQYSLLYQAYHEEMKKRGKLDFDDMLYDCKCLLENRKQVKEAWQNRFRFILVDEFQDTNKIQYELLKILAEKHKNLFVVGDDDQSIYGFRGADPDIMQLFTKDFINTKVYILNKNYRSTKSIVGAAAKVIGENKHRMPKNIQAANTGECADINWIKADSITDEYEKICERIEKEDSKDIAVIFRTHGEMELMQAYLDEFRIPYRMAGNTQVRKSFVEKDVLLQLRFLTKAKYRKDFLRINEIYHLEISREYLPREEFDLSQLMKNLGEMEETKALKETKKFFEKIRVGEKLSNSLKLRFIRKTLGYDDYLKSVAGQDEIYFLYLLKEADRMEKLVSKLETRDLDRWLSEEVLPENLAEKKTNERDECKVLLLTMHASKGLEFDIVFIPNINEGRIPHGKNLSDRELEEERRIFYVGMTRAKKKLYLCYEKEQKEKPGKISRFLEVLHII